MRWKVAEILVEQKDKVNAVLDIEMQHSIQTRQRNFLWLRRKRSSLAKGATKTASARRKKNAERERPPSGQAEAGDQRWMLDFVETSPQLLSQGIFTTARFIGLTPTLPKTIGTVVRPVTMRYPLRHRPLWDGGEDWEIPTGADGVLLWSPSVPTLRVPLPFAIWRRGRSFDWKLTQL